MSIDGTAKKKLPNFVSSLRAILDDSPKEKVSWSKDGSIFHIYDKDYFEKNIQTKYYSSTSFSSFVRQLNFYQFKKVPNEEDKESKNHLCFHHQFFTRDNPEDMYFITRKVNQSALDREVSGLKETINTLQVQFQDVLRQMQGLNQRVTQLSERLDSKFPETKRSKITTNCKGEFNKQKTFKTSVLGKTKCNPPPLERYSSSDYISMSPFMGVNSPSGKSTNKIKPYMFT